MGRLTRRTPIPYISSKDDRRERLRNGEPALTAGELNYQIFYYVKHNWARADFCRKTIKRFVEQFLGSKRNYQKYNDMTGALIRCIRELNRRLYHLNDKTLEMILDIMNSYDEEIAKYEDKKIIENKDVE